jgi:hypothetical protein
MASRNSFRSLASSIFNLGVSRPAATPAKDIGGAGFAVYGGWIDSGERNPKLTGDRRWLTVSDILANTSIVAAGLRYFLNLVAKSNWTVEPAEDQPGADDPSSDAAKEAAEFAEEVMYDMQTAWVRFVRRSAMYKFHGFGIQEWTSKKRDDGRLGFFDIKPRPQSTIVRWDIDENSNVIGFTQRKPQTQEEVYLPRWKTVYLVDDSLSDSPEGMGLFRHLVEPAERLKAYLKQEGFGYERDLRGVPVGRAPFAELDRAVKNGSMTAEDKASMLNTMTDIIRMEVRKADSGILLDSTTYPSQSADGTTVSAVYKWAIELLTGGVNGLTDVGNAVNRLNREMARILGVEQLMLGESGGSRALSEDKSSALFMQIESVLGDLAEGYERDIFGPIWAMNGLDDALKPTLKFEAVQFRDVQKIGATLRDMATAGATLDPEDPAIDDMRDLMGLSRVPEEISTRLAADAAIPREAAAAVPASPTGAAKP